MRMRLSSMSACNPVINIITTTTIISINITTIIHTSAITQVIEVYLTKYTGETVGVGAGEVPR